MAGLGTHKTVETSAGQMTYIQAIQSAMRDEMERDESVILMGEDVGAKGGVFKATEGLQVLYGDTRVIDTPLAESAIVGVAIGAALNGMRPIAEIQFADFIHPAFNQIVSEAAKMRYRTNGDWSVPMVIRAPFGGGVHGALYHSQSVEAFFAHVPGLKVVIPSTPYDAKGLLISAIRDPDPVLFFEHKKAYRLVKGEVPEGENYSVPIGRARVARQGKDMSVFAYGLMVHYCVAAAEQMAAEDGYSVEVIDLRTVKPLDRPAILESARKTGKSLVVYEANRTLGVGAEVAAIIAEECFEYLDGPVVRLAGPDVPAMPFSPPMEEFFLPDTKRILSAMRRLAAY
ncbi:MAG: 2-oxoisovalerate dehydrogenase component beta subunit [Chloroflexota bacterium]|jgi:2-oxoisovalerate dehydrogenase E1 component beta subunit|nr:2-oxoisovalerate dehydrogenase component beta subunit [Chloroflexota bacterium]